MITQKLDLNLIHGQVRPRVNVSQFDSGTRTLEIAVYNNTARFTLLGTYTVSIEGRKPDNTAFQYDGIIDTVNNVATFDVTEQMTAVYGDVVVEMVINDGDDRIGTGNFILAVEAAPLNDDSVISESVLPLVQRAADIAEIIDDVVLPIRVEKDFAPIISMSDAISKNAIDIKAKIEPVQDLHGYASPWVGGADKNLLPLTVADIKAANTSGTWNGNVYTRYTLTFEIVTDNDGNVTQIKVNGTNNTANNVYMTIPQTVTINGSYKVNGCPSGGVANTGYWQSVRKGVSETYVVNETGSGATFTASNDTYGMYLMIGPSYTANNVIFKPMIYDASITDATFAPYSNICPITGHSEAKITRTGKNLYIGSPSFDGYTQLSWWTKQTETYNEHEVYKRSGAWSGTYKLVYLKEGTYTFSVAVKTSDSGQVGIFAAMPSITTAVMPLAQKTHIATSTSWSKISFTFSVTTAGTVALRVEKEAAGDVYISEYQIEVGETATDYEPYTADVYTIDLDGTRYKGTLDVTTGELTVTHAIMAISDKPWGMTSDYFYCIDVKNKNAGNFNLSSSAYKTTTSDTVAGMANGEIKGSASNYNIYVKDFSCADENEFVSKRGAEQILYELATPLSIALDPQDVLMLWAYNTLFADTGDISLIYDATGILRIAHEKLDIDTFKAVVAASSDFADFKTRVAAL